MHWTEIARRNHVRAQRALAARAKRAAVSVPLGDSDYTAPGYLHLGHLYSCVPDPLYPWDPAVLAAIRELVPDAMPLVIRSVWQWSNYNELGHLAEPIVLVRHGIGRAIRNPTFKTHDYYCSMPSWPVPGLRIPGRTMEESTPNYIETYWHNSDDRPLGQDLPGTYRPFDWLLYHRYREAEDDRNRALKESRREENEAGEVVAKGAADETLAGARAVKTHKDESRRDEEAYISRDLSNFYSIEPSDVEWKEAHLGDSGGTV